MVAMEMGSAASKVFEVSSMRTNNEFLHKEIVTFCDCSSSTPEEQAPCDVAVHSIFDVIKYTWHAYKSEFFGLFRAWLYSPTSDIDVVIKLFTVEARGTGKTSSSWLIILSLYSRLTGAEHELVFSPTPKGRRKTVVTTNIEVGSLTLEGIVYVFDSGFSKQRFYNLSAGIESLVLATISKTSAKQRVDKAGRIRTRKCYRLYSTECYLNAMFV
ncbi:hypothetical protein V6N11_084122 [Hibiscus sabdariffa]|uniref:RNA helicase n=1 Tax=Hibiscus sabdariffa TaxID=183260 RepID=A0ABR2QDR3_9ROSI